MDEARSLGDGAKVLADWLGEGGLPVPGEQAARRATVCLACPMNLTSRVGLLNMIKRSLIRVVQEHLRWKNHLQLTLPFDKRLGVCKACSCVLQLKVWVPTKFIAETTEDTARFHPACWIPKELNET